MSLPERLREGLAVPAIAAPMFLVSGPDLVVEACQAGVIGTFPSLNQRTSEGYEAWLNEIEERLARVRAETGRAHAAYGVNLIVHKTNERLERDLEITVRHRVPLVITSLGAARAVVDAIHSYGGVVVHDVIHLHHARKAADAGVDGLIAVCAGIGLVGDVTETTEEDYDRLMSVNVKGVFLCAQAEVRWMKEHGGGAIINTSSVAGLVGVDRRFAYSTTKGAVTAMTKQLAVDHVKDRIRVNCVCPGTVETPFVDAYLAKYHAGEEEATRVQLRARQPLGRLGQPDEIAYAMLYLASDEAAFVTGSALIIDGGLTAR